MIVGTKRDDVNTAIFAISRFIRAFPNGIVSRVSPIPAPPPPTPQGAPPARGDASAPEAAAAEPPDGALLNRLERREVKARREQPPEVSEALGHVSKQFQLWNIRRQEVEVEEVRREPVEVAHDPMGALGPGSRRTLAEATRALAGFVPASALAKKGFVGFRALKRLVLGRPYKPAG